VIIIIHYRDIRFINEQTLIPFLFIANPNLNNSMYYALSFIVIVMQ